MIIVVAIAILVVGIFIWDRWLIQQKRLEEEKLPDSVKAQREAGRRAFEYDHPFGKPSTNPGETTISPGYVERLEKWHKHIAKTGEYRGREDVFDEILMFRNPKRRGSTGSCRICGGSYSHCTSNGGLIQHSVCDVCMKQIEAKLNISQAEDNLTNYEKRKKLERCMAIAYDLNDGIISEGWARADMKAAERICLENIERENKMQSAKEHRRIEQQNIINAEHYAADEIVQRLLQ
ncbi:MAG: hypothetical protein HFI06_12615 [Eubacterium sp.]|jgi:hypothetical protein|uniref:hypothetical protein n=1 Tax=Acutalibacter muris TaxID=1796620 RepID=UPI002171E713|nr:hypothetical protein [Acutalibacter muris]MCI9379315.1 hypothetical protein [Eubacterium sp.]